MNKPSPAAPVAPAAPAPQIVVTHDPTPTPQGATTLRALRQAVAQALDRKRRLGQYAVVWQNGQVVEIGLETPPLMP